MPAIAHIAANWSLTDYPNPKRPWPLERRIKAIVDAGFDGMAARLTPEHRRLAEKHGVRHLLGFISTSNPEEFAVRIREQKESGAVHIHVQLDDHDTPPSIATKHWIRLVREAEKVGGVALSLEIHRDCCTETPEKTYEIAERYDRATGERIKLTFDFSHFAVVKHLNPSNYAARLLNHPDLVQHSEQTHCRPFNGHHCQVPVSHRGRLTPEVMSYLTFVKAFFLCWKSTPQNRQRTLFVVPEMGPYAEAGSGYNITGLPQAWPDAVILRRELANVWKNAKPKLSPWRGD